MDPKSYGNNGSGNPRMGERIDNLGDSAQHLMNEARGAVDQLAEALDVHGRVQRHPFGMLMAAFGVGYVLGGGLFTPTTARVVRLGMKLAALPLVKDELINMAEAAVDGFASQQRNRTDYPEGGTP